MRIGISLRQFRADEAVSVEPLVWAEGLRHRIKLPAAFADRFACTRSIGVDVLACERLNTNLMKDFRIVLDGHVPALRQIAFPLVFPIQKSGKIWPRNIDLSD